MCLLPYQIYILIRHNLSFSLTSDLLLFKACKFSSLSTTLSYRDINLSILCAGCVFIIQKRHSLMSYARKQTPLCADTRMIIYYFANICTHRTIHMKFCNFKHFLGVLFISKSLHVRVTRCFSQKNRTFLQKNRTFKFQ